MKRLLIQVIAILMIFMLAAFGCGSNAGSEEAASAEEETEETDQQAEDQQAEENNETVPEMVPVEVSEAVSEEPETEVTDEEAGEQSESNEELSAEADTGSDDETEEEEASMDQEGIFTSEPIPDDVFARMSGVSYPDGCPIAREDLRYLRLSYHDFNGNTQVGELVCNKKVAEDMTEIFRELYKRGYQIDKMKLIDDYGGDDDISCAEDNTSCFNYRTVAGTNNLSKHALGVAIDINPFYNPYVTYPNGVERISPPGSEPYADRSADFPHKIGPGDDAYELFMAHGFTWGGNWKSLKDYQHFQKAV